MTDASINSEEVSKMSAEEFLRWFIKDTEDMIVRNKRLLFELKDSLKKTIEGKDGG